MLIRKEIKIQDIQNSITGNRWSFGNEILYEMCRKNPKHKNVVIFTSGYIGTIEDVNPSSGGVLAAWRKKALIAPLGL